MTSNPPAVIQTLNDAHINGFNTQDNDLFLSVFGDTAIIIDGIAPYRWLNPNAPANWLDDVEKWRENLGVTSEHLSYEMGFGGTTFPSMRYIAGGIARFSSFATVELCPLFLMGGAPPPHFAFYSLVLP